MDTSVPFCRSVPQFSNLISPKPDNPVQFLSLPFRPAIFCHQKSTPVPPPHAAAAVAGAATRQNTIESQLMNLSQNGKLRQAVSVLENGSAVDSMTYISLLQSCIDSDSIALGRRLHAKIGLVREKNTFVETKLVSMYAKCGCLEEARQVFNGMTERNLFTWSAMIGACARDKRWDEVVDLFYQMMREASSPDRFLLPKILQACSNSEDVETGRLLHSLAVRLGFLRSPVGGHVSNSILAMYAKCGELCSARRFFEKMVRKDSVSWNAMISGECQHGENEEAIRLFKRMQTEGVEPGIITWNILITSYNQSGNSDQAMEVMKKMEQSGFVPDVYTWTSMISGLAQNNRTIQALDLFREMQLANVEPNGMTFAVALSSCASLKALGKGKELHSLAVKMGYAGTVLVGNSLIDMYSKCGTLEDAERVFYRISERDVFTLNSMIGGFAQAGYCGKAYDLFSKMEDSGVWRNIVTWNVMVSGYMQNGDEDQAMELFQRMETDGIGRNTTSWNLLIAGSLHNGNRNEALRVFRQMQSLSVKPNPVTILSVLPACANLTSPQMVKEIHACVLQRGLQSEVSIVNSLIDTYAKSGDIDSAQSLFDNISCRDTITWNSLISAYVLHRCPELALNLFNRMKTEESKPNPAMLVSTIRAYGLLKMVNEGKDLFYSMTDSYQISPGLEHYAAMVDLYGRSGRFEEASEFIQKMPIEPDFTVWSSLLTAGRIHGNTRVAKLAAKCLVELEPRNPTIQRLFLQIQTLCSRCSTREKLTKFSKGYKIDETLGCCWIGHSKGVLKFSTGDNSVPNGKSIYAKLDALTEEFKMAKQDFHKRHLGIEEEETEANRGIHSEKLAIAFALISTPNCRNIRIIKNLRMCFNCHAIARHISMAYQCEILLKDTKCLHHFKNGHCSCGDYW